MEIWSVGWSEVASTRESVARCLSLDGESMTEVPKPVVNVTGGHDEAIGAGHVHIASEAHQQQALAHVGLVEWIVLFLVGLLQRVETLPDDHVAGCTRT